MFNNYEGVIFDLDGTLIDSMGIWHQIDIDYLGEKGIPLPDDLQSKIEGFSFRETAVYFKERFQLPESVEEIMDVWNTMSFEMYTNGVTLKPGVMEILEHIKEKGLKLAIATSNSTHLTNSVLKAMGIDNYFDCIVTGNDVKKGKPDPEIYLKAAKILNLNPSKCFVFEDIPNGILAGKNAGMTTCAIEDEYSLDLKDIKAELADYYTIDYNSFLKEYC